MDNSLHYKQFVIRGLRLVLKLTKLIIRFMVPLVDGSRARFTNMFFLIHRRRIELHQNCLHEENVLDIPVDNKRIFMP